MAPCHIIDSDLERVFTSIRLQQGWRETIIERVIALSERERIAGERRQVEERLKRLGRAYVDGMISERAYTAETGQLRARLASLNVPEVDIAIESAALLEQLQEIWRQATTAERHKLLAGMLEAVYIDVPTRQLVGITPKGPFRQAFSALEGKLLIPPDEARSRTLWWRRRGVEPLVQTKASPNLLQA